MKGKSKNRRGFITIPLLVIVIASIFVVSVIGTGVILYKREQQTISPQLLQIKALPPASSLLPEKISEIEIEKCKIEAGVLAEIFAEEAGKQAYDKTFSQNSLTLNTDSSSRILSAQIQSFNRALVQAKEAAQQFSDTAYDLEYSNRYNNFYLNCLDR